jgi:hypothetical protein
MTTCHFGFIPLQYQDVPKSPEKNEEIMSSETSCDYLIINVLFIVWVNLKRQLWVFAGNILETRQEHKNERHDKWF